MVFRFISSPPAVPASNLFLRASSHRSHNQPKSIDPTTDRHTEPSLSTAPTADQPRGDLHFQVSIMLHSSDPVECEARHKAQKHEITLLTGGRLNGTAMLGTPELLAARKSMLMRVHKRYIDTIRETSWPRRNAFYGLRRTYVSGGPAERESYTCEISDGWFAKIFLCVFFFRNSL